jgi:hypothetical protein
MNMRGSFPALMLLATALFPVAVRADDAGPPHVVAQIRSEARRLLAHRVRAFGVDPKEAAIADVTVQGDRATLSWNAGGRQGTMDLAYHDDRWWATDSTLSSTAGYDLTVHFAANDAGGPVHLTQIYARAPTAAEFLPNHPIAPGWGYSNAVCFFDLAIGGKNTIVFAPGTTIDIWFPFVLDDQLRYTLSFFSNDKPSGLIVGSIFDNTLHFALPQFVMAPDKPFMAEIDGDPKFNRS